MLLIVCCYVSCYVLAMFLLWFCYAFVKIVICFGSVSLICVCCGVPTCLLSCCFPFTRLCYVFVTYNLLCVCCAFSYTLAIHKCYITAMYISVLNDPSSKYISAQSTSEVATSWHHLRWSAPKHAAKQNLKPVCFPSIFFP